MQRNRAARDRDQFNQASSLALRLAASASCRLHIPPGTTERIFWFCSAL